MNQITLGGIDEAQLKPLVELGQGGQGVVHTTAYRLPGIPMPLAYKQFRPGSSFDDLSVLANLIDRRPLLTAPGSHLRSGAWPLQLVTKQGQVSGFLMQVAPDTFFFKQPLPKGPPKRRLLEVQHLLNPPAQLLHNHLSISDQWRLEFLKDVARILAELHVQSIAVGDLSPKNILASLTAQPRCFLLDCDAVTLKDRSLFAQSETTEWEAPDARKGTQATDAFKFALLAIRLFGCDQFTRDPNELGRVGPALTALARRGLESAEMRPPLGEWLDALSRAPQASTVPLPGNPPRPTVTPTTGRTGGSTSPRATAPPSTSSPRPPTAPPPAPGTISTPRRKSRTRMVAVSALAGLLIYVNPAPLQSFTGPVHDQMGSWIGQAQQYVKEQQAIQQARDVNRVLATSVADRTGVATAVKAVADCDNGPMEQWLTPLANSTQSRHQSVTTAKNLDVDLLTSGAKLKKALIRSLELSAAADDAYLTWATRRVEQNCSKKSRTTKLWKKALARSDDAAEYKSDVGRLWKPIAVQYELPQYSRKNL